ncbi:MAG: DUF2062 domain-containing protein [Bacteroidales bacterium]|nr:DUF2062 domain-containing protein [Bacteroidales bacterium]
MNQKERPVKSNWCVIVPTYNNCRTLGEVLKKLLSITKDVVVVNDGSTDQTADILATFSPLQVISYPDNRGKGFALRKGFTYALDQGYDYAVTIDADGQHRPENIISLVGEIQHEPDSLIIGTRDFQQVNLSRGSRFANKFSNFWFRFLTGIRLQDTQSGFRLYPIRLLETMRFYTTRFEFEFEILVRSAWKGIPIKSLPVAVSYPEGKERVSHFRPFSDFLRITLLNTVLVFIALLYIKPFYFIRYLRKDTILEFIKKQIIHTRDSMAKTTFSVMFGVFMGIVPIWGYQLVTAIALAYLFRLNKFIVIVASNISIPPMIPFILYASYVTGGWVLRMDQNILYRTSDITFEFVKNNLYQYVVGSLVFAVIFALFSGLITYLLLRFFKKNTVLTE